MAGAATGALGTGARVARDAGGRRTRARRIARLLSPAAWALGGFASAEARVHAGLGVLLRPDVVVGLGDPPGDGVLREAPLLVVMIEDPPRVAAWLALGGTVWAPWQRGARAWHPDGTVTTVGPRERLELPGSPGLALPAAELWDRAALRPGEDLR